MNLKYPSREFDDTVADLLHGSFTTTQAHAFNELLLKDQCALDEYLHRSEMHGYLTSKPDLFLSSYALDTQIKLDRRSDRSRGIRLAVLVAGLAASIAFIALGFWNWNATGTKQETLGSPAVAMLHKAVEAHWDEAVTVPRLGEPIKPGVLRLKSGLAQIVLYGGARIVLQGPTELQLISAKEVHCSEGRLGIEVPTQAEGFRVGTPHAYVIDEDSHFGLSINESSTELQVFEGRLNLHTNESNTNQELVMGSGALIESGRPMRILQASQSEFESLFALQQRSEEYTKLRFQQWKTSNEGLNEEPSLIVHFDFQKSLSTDWQLPNVSRSRYQGYEAPAGTIVGGQWISGRWPLKSALSFNSMNDRVGLSVPAVIGAMTMAGWIRVQGLDRQFNSLFMCQGFEPGTVHWLIRSDGVLGLTLIGPKGFQIVPSPPVVTLDKLGMWIHVAVVVDSDRKLVSHYLNGERVAQESLKIAPPYRLGEAELGNWDPNGFRGHDSTLIRNFSGAMDEFCLFSRAFDDKEIGLLYEQGKQTGGDNATKSN